MALSMVSTAQKFLFLRDISCGNNVEPRSLLRTMVLWPEGHGLRSSDIGDGCSVSLESLGEMKEEMNFTSSDGLWLG